jgi:hypothetical protein
MNAQNNTEAREHDLTMHVFAVSSGMVGVCLTAIGLLRLVAAQTQAQTIGDDLLAINAILFATCAFLAFWSFKTGKTATRRRLRLFVDIFFLIALASTGAICALIAYTIF